MGFDDPCFAETDDQLAAQVFKREGPTAGFDWHRLKQSGWERLDVPEKYAPFAEGGFATPSGRCEFYSEQVSALGLDPVPAYIAPYETPDGGALARRYPLAIISPPARHFLNSTFVNVTSLRSIDGEPTVEIHPSDAHRARCRRRRSRSYLQRSRQHRRAGARDRSGATRLCCCVVYLVEKAGARWQERERADQRSIDRHRKSANVFRLSRGSRPCQRTLTAMN